MPVKEIVVAIVLVIAIITGTVFSVGVDIAIGGNNKAAPASAESTTAAADDDKSALADDNEEEKPNNTDLSDLNLNSINDLTADNHKIKCRDNLNDYGKKYTMTCIRRFQGKKILNSPIISRIRKKGRRCSEIYSISCSQALF